MDLTGVGVAVISFVKEFSSQLKKSSIINLGNGDKSNYGLVCESEETCLKKDICSAKRLVLNGQFVSTADINKRLSNLTKKEREDKFEANIADINGDGKEDKLSIYFITSATLLNQLLLNSDLCEKPYGYWGEVHFNESQQLLFVIQYSSGEHLMIEGTAHLINANKKYY